MKREELTLKKFIIKEELKFIGVMIDEKIINMSFRPIFEEIEHFKMFLHKNEKTIEIYDIAFKLFFKTRDEIRYNFKNEIKFNVEFGTLIIDDLCSDNCLNIDNIIQIDFNNSNYREQYLPVLFKIMQRIMSNNTGR